MKILFADYRTGLLPGRKHEEEVLKKNHPDWETVFFEYDDNPEAFYQVLEDADALVTAFLKIDDEVLDHAEKLKLISVDATGYNAIDLDAARKHGVRVCAVRDYCSDDVAEFAVSLACALVKNIKDYNCQIDEQKTWDYSQASPQKRLSEQVLGIFGLGRIGQKTLRLARGLGMEVVAYDPFLPGEISEKLGVRMLSREEMFRKCDLLINHMRLTDETKNFFSSSEFFMMKEKHPYFINVARGESVDEKALLTALDRGFIKGCALDVLQSEHPDLESCPFVGRKNVLLSPHAAFYSQTSMEKLEEITCQNVVSFLEGKHDDVDWFVD